MNNNNEKKLINDILPMLVAEAVVAVLVVLGAFILSLAKLINFDFTIITGAILGMAVMVFNYLFLTLSVDKAISDFMALRGDREMDDEEAEQFAAQNSASIQNAIKTSFIIRTLSMLVTLVVAFLLDWFNPMATAIPLLAMRPLLYVMEIIKGKTAK